MFPRNQWYAAAESAELKDAPVGRILLNEPVVLYRRADGLAVALEDRCCHRRAPLSKGKIEGDRLRCVGRVMRRTRQVWHTSVECFDASDALVGTGTGTFVVVPR